MTYRWAEHTAEVELEIEAPTEEAVFTEALHALAELLGDGARGDRVSCAVAVTGPERAVLLAQWLDELVYRAETEDLVPEEVERIELSEGGLRTSSAVVERAELAARVAQLVPLGVVKG